VQGSDEAIVLAERYRQQGGSDGWAEIAYAEYALNARVPPDTRRQAIEGLEALRSRDASFIRPYILSARLLLANHAPEAAANALEAATALNPGHKLARELLTQAQSERSEEVEP
jgi:hypothetical protein